MIHLDTSFIIRALVPRSAEDRLLRRWLKEGEPLGMSTIAWTEFLCGPLEDTELAFATEVLKERAAFTAEDSEIAARLYNLAGRRRGTLADCMIAATAIRSAAPLATANPDDFRKLETAGLKLLASAQRPSDLPAT